MVCGTKTFLADPLRFLRLLARCHVAGKTTGVCEFSLLPEDARIDNDVLDRAVLAPKAGGIFLDRLVMAEATENVLDDRLVYVKVGNMASDVLLAAIAEEIQFCLVRPEDHPVWPHPVHGDGCVLNKIRQFTSLFC